MHRYASLCDSDKGTLVPEPGYLLKIANYGNS